MPSTLAGRGMCTTTNAIANATANLAANANVSVAAGASWTVPGYPGAHSNRDECHVHIRFG